MSARNIITLRRLLAPTVALADAAAGPPSGTLAPGTVYEYVAACRDAAGNYSPRAIAVKQGTPTSVGAILLGLTVPVSPCTLVIWRGAAGGAISAPSAYLDIPIDSARLRMFDTGANLNGVPWKTTSIPAVASSTTNQTYHGTLFPATGIIHAHGTGTPETAVTAPVGSIWTRTDGAAGTTLYAKETGSGNTGWAAIPDASATASNTYGFPCTVDPGMIRTGDALSVQVANQAIYQRVTGGGTISSVGLQVAVSSGNISVAVYSNSGAGRAAVPGTRVAATGAIACPAVGYQEIALGSSVAVSPGDWIAITADNTTATFRSLLAAGADSGLGNGRQYRQTTAHPAPATPASLVATIGYTIVLIGV